MTERDPLDHLSAASGPERPDPQFADRLIDSLLSDLDDTLATSGHLVEVIDLQEDASMDTPNRKWLWSALAAAAVIAIIISAVALTGGEEDEPGPVIADQPTATAAPTPAPTAAEEPEVDEPSVPDPEPEPGEEGSAAPTAEEAVIASNPPFPTSVEPSDVAAETARALIDAAGGADGLTVATIEEPGLRTSIVTFDPLDNDRVLFGDLDVFTGAGPWLWDLESGEVSPFAPEGRTVGQFTRDGLVLASGTQYSFFTYLLDGDGVELESLGGPPATFPYLLMDGVGPNAIFPLSSALSCPFFSTVISQAGGVLALDGGGGNAFGRVAIVEPNVAMAFPSSSSGSCDELTSVEAAAWDVLSGTPLPEHPMAGRAIAYAATSADGSRGITLGLDGTVEVISMADGATVATLVSIEGAAVLRPVALNPNGSLAAVATDDGSLQLWHVETGELLLETTSSVRSGLDGTAVAASLAYDASRAALLDTSGDVPTWTVVSLDPNSWLERACGAGFEISAEDRSASRLDESVAC